MIDDFLDGHPLLAALAVVLLLLLYFLVSTGVVELLASSGYGARVIAAIITAFATLMAALFALLGGYLQQRWRINRERRGVATALLLELYSQCDAVAHCGSIANAVIKDESDTFSRDKFEFLMPPAPTVYPALAAQLTTLPAAASSCIIAFYGSVEAARGLTAMLPDPKPSGDGLFIITEVPPWRKNNITEAWKSAAYRGVQAIKSLEQIADAGKKNDEAEKLDQLKEELSEIALTGATPKLKT